VDKTTSGFNYDHAIQQYSRGVLLESAFVPSSTNRWAVREKNKAKRPLPVAIELKPEVEIWRQGRSHGEA